jgi:hypothetical protein
VTGAKGLVPRRRRRRIEMEFFCFLVSIANEHDLRAGNGEDGVQITVMTDNYQEYYEQCSRWRASVFLAVMRARARALAQYCVWQTSSREVTRACCDDTKGCSKSFCPCFDLYS